MTTRLNDQQARDRLDWLTFNAGAELVDHCYMQDSGWFGVQPQVGVSGVEKLREIARIARLVANHYEGKINS